MQSQFLKQLEKQDITLSSRQINQFETYRKMLQEYNKKMNLTAITDTEGIYIKHFYDSIIPSFHYEMNGSLLDVGAGAGFPSIPLKIIYPELRVTILEPIGKRVRFLHDLCDKLDIDVTIINERAEDYIRNTSERFDIVSARAVANLPILAELCLPFVKVGGVFIAMKGAKAESELIDSQHAIEILGGSLDKIIYDQLDGADRSTIIIDKVKKTPSKYPRNFGQIKKKPL